MARRAPSLVDLCVQVAIANARYLGDVGETDFHLLERILPHCTLDQVVHIEQCTKARNIFLWIPAPLQLHSSNHILFDCIEGFSYTYLLQGRDLSPVTNQVWKTFFELDFGAHSVNVVVERMKKEKVKFPWRKLYEVANFPFFPVTLHTGKRHSIVLFYIWWKILCNGGGFNFILGALNISFLFL